MIRSTVHIPNIFFPGRFFKAYRGSEAADSSLSKGGCKTKLFSSHQKMGCSFFYFFEAKRSERRHPDLLHDGLQL